MEMLPKTNKTSQFFKLTPATLTEQGKVVYRGREYILN